MRQYPAFSGSSIGYDGRAIGRIVMRALICRHWGSIDELELGEMPVPKPGADEVLIRIKATAVNYADSIMVAGRYQTKPELPFSPGLETAGVIEACGVMCADLRKATG
jgi:NADPH2:quinone reductase